MSDEQRTLQALQDFATSRGGECLATGPIAEGEKTSWRCGRGHDFEASPRLLIVGGYWCPECFPRVGDTAGWDYDSQITVDPLLAKFYIPA